MDRRPRWLSPTVEAEEEERGRGGSCLVPLRLRLERCRLFSDGDIRVGHLSVCCYTEEERGFYSKNLFILTIKQKLPFMTDPISGWL